MLRDAQIAVQALAPECLCKTTLAKGLALRQCTQCSDTTEYTRECPPHQIPAPFWAPTQMVAWQMPWLFEAAVNAGVLQDYDNMLDQDGEPSDIIKSCALLHLSDALIVLLAASPIVTVAAILVRRAIAICFDLVMLMRIWGAK